MTRPGLLSSALWATGRLLMPSLERVLLRPHCAGSNCTVHTELCGTQGPPCGNRQPKIPRPPPSEA
eukprot:8931202-Alexandrium_andersonii.AAC.1